MSKVRRRIRKKKPWAPQGYIFSALRRIWRYSPDKRKAIVLAAGKCAQCGIYDADAQVDHIIPVVGEHGFDGDWSGYINRLFFSGIGNLQVLCLVHHKEKSKAENAVRRNNKKIRKQENANAKQPT